MTMFNFVYGAVIMT